jgi:hypothetical protein
MVPGLLARERYAFLIVPADAAGAAIVGDLAPGSEAEQVFGDGRFELYRLAERAP